MSLENKLTELVTLSGQLKRNSNFKFMPIKKSGKKLVFI